MVMLGNILWFVLGGGALALFWLVIGGLFYVTIIGAPIGRACVEFAKLSAFPFGKEIIRESELRGRHMSGAKKVFNGVLNILWLGFGVPLTITYLLYGILSCCTIIGIPVGLVYLKMGKFILFPAGARVVAKR